MELVVVIAILGVLLGLVVPGLGRARGLGRSTVCLGNLHQIGIALQLYVDDHGHCMPVMRDKAVAGEVEPGDAGKAGSVPEPAVPSPDLVLAQVLSAPAVFRCPSDRARLFENTGSSYSWNSLLNGQDPDRLRVMSLDLEAHQVPVFFDKEGFHRERGPGKAVNFLYADGHLKNRLVLEGGR
ncbi:MAG: type II secretion system protein [Verrucomicrobiales bacterium]|nr:type II secretion system protein [Verrucomicrobiales bacterium]